MVNKKKSIEERLKELESLSEEERDELVADFKEKSDVLSKQTVARLLRDGTFEKNMEKWEKQTFEEHRAEGQKIISSMIENLSSGELYAIFPTTKRKELETLLREIQKRDMEKDSKTLEMEYRVWQEQLQRYRKIRDEA